MTQYEIETRGDAREVYVIDASSEQEARELFEADPMRSDHCLTEVTGVTIVSIKEEK